MSWKYEIQKKFKAPDFLDPGPGSKIRAKPISTPNDAVDPTGFLPSAGNHSCRRHNKSRGRPTTSHDDDEDASRRTTKPKQTSG